MLARVSHHMKVPTGEGYVMDEMEDKEFRS
jgi:hypothetical protein